MRADAGQALRRAGNPCHQPRKYGDDDRAHRRSEGGIHFLDADFGENRSQPGKYGRRGGVYNIHAFTSRHI